MPSTLEIESPKPKAHRGRKLGAALTATGVLITPFGHNHQTSESPNFQLPPAASALKAPPKKKHGRAHKAGSKVTVKKPAPPAENPVSNNADPSPALDNPELKVTDQDREQLRQSTVKILSRPKGSDGPWWGFCTGAVVSFKQPHQDANGNMVSIDPDQKFVITASHCFDEETGAFLGTFSQDFPVGAVNFIDNAKYEYAIADPIGGNYDGWNPTPVALVDGISIDTEGIDFALLSVSPINPKQNEEPYGHRSMGNIPAIPYDTYSATPVEGQEIAMYGMPRRSGNNPVIGIGKFLGTVNVGIGNGKIATVNVMGINAEQPQNNPCDYGASGAVSKGDGVITGPGARLVELTGGAEFEVQYKQGVARSDPRYQKAVDDFQSLENAWWDIYSQKLKKDLSGFNTLCISSVPTPRTIGSLVNGLNYPSAKYLKR